MAFSRFPFFASVIACSGVTLFTAGFAQAAVAPANDMFGQSAVISSASGSALTYNTFATTEEGEPSHGVQAFSRSLWWSWTAPANGWANFSTAGSGRPLLIAVYTGDTLETLSSVAVTNPLSSLDEPRARDSVSLPVVAGQTYHIAVAVPQASAAPSTPLADRVVFGVNQPPTIVSDGWTRGVKGASFGYQILATNDPTRYSALGLPPGLVLNPWTGAITGAPTAAGIFDGEISATGPGGTTTASIRLEIAAETAPLQPPDFSYGSAAVIGYVGASLSQYYNVSPSMSAFSAAPLPPGLVSTLGSSGSYGTISGVPTQAGTFKIALQASNAVGSRKAVTTFKILADPPSPIITSQAVAYGTVGAPFSYSFNNIYVENDDRSPTYTTGDLPAGLALKGTSISGTPTTAGTYTVPVQATNDGGTTNATLTIVIVSPTDVPAPVEAAPVLSSASGAVGVSGRTFSYSVSADNSPATFSATGLPTGLSINPTTGEIFGTSTQSGTFRTTISATNASGTTTTPLTLTFKAPKPPLLTSAAAAAGTVGASFSYTLIAKDSEFSIADFYYYPRTSTVQFQVGSLPGGLSFRSPSNDFPGFDTTYGYITGTPTAAGTYRVPISATAHGVTTNAVLTLIIADQQALPPVITSAAVAHGNVGTSFSYSLSASNAPTARAISSLPPGLSFNASTGSISGTPTLAGTFVVDASATNSVGTGTAKLTFLIDPAPELSPSTSGNAATEGSVGTGFSSYVYFSNSRSESVTFTASGLPPGLTIPASSTGSYALISGTPTAAGTFPVTIDVRGSGSATQIMQTLVIRPSVDPPTITSPLSADGYVGQSFSYSISGNGEGNLTYMAEPLPPGLSFSGSRISGTPTTAGTYEIPLSASNATGTSTGTLILRIAALPPAPVLNVSATTRVYLNQAFSQKFSASGNVTAYALSGALPAGVSFNPSGQSLTGTPTQTGSFPLRITATGSGGSVTVPVTLEVEATLPPPVITSPVAAWGYSYDTYRITASNFPTSFDAANLPPGITFTAASGSFSGYVMGGSMAYPTTISATNSAGKTSATVTFLNIPPYSSGPSFGPAMALGALNAPFSYQFINYLSSSFLQNFSAAGLPAGLTMNSSTSVISGVPVESGTFAVKISATTVYSPYPVEATLTLIIQDVPQKPIITSYGLLPGAVGVAFTSTLSGTNAVSFSADGLPAGLSLDAASGKITGTPTAAGRYPVKAGATNAGGTTTSDLIFDIAAAPAVPTFSSAAAARGYQGVSFSYSISATNQPTRYEADGLPPGLVINSSTGTISGFPAAPGNYVATLRAINAGGAGTARLAIDITVPDTPVISSSGYVEGMVGKSVSYSISGSDSPTSFSASDLPPGLVLNTATGSIKGIPTTPGIYLASIGATNAGGTGSARVLFRILSGEPSWLTSAAGASGLVGSPFSMSLYDSEYGYVFETENLPPGLSLTGNLISGSPTVAGTYLVPVHVRNGDRVTDATLTFQIDAAPLLPPIVTSPLTKGIILGKSNAHPISATNAPSDITATSLPAGFSYDSSTWSVSGFPDSAGSYSVEISATNAPGSTTAQITYLAVPPETQIFTAPATAFGAVGSAIFYPVSLTRDTISSWGYTADWAYYDLLATPVLNVRNLPPGLYFDRTSQEIHGRATLAGDYPVELLSADVFGNIISTTVLFRISETITSSPSPLKISGAPLCAAGAVGSPFSLNIWPTGLATDIAVKNLPPGLTMATSSGSSNGSPTKFAEISGRPAAAGIYPVEFTFSNGTETATAVVTILIPKSPLPPGLDSSLVARGTVGRSFLHSIWETLSLSFHNAPTTYKVNDLPPGLSFDLTNHLIKGTPTQPGRYSVPISLTNAGGTTTATLTIVIDDLDVGRPRLTGFSAGATGYVGQDFTFALRGDNTITNLSVSGLPETFTLVRTGSGTWEIRGTPTEAGTSHLFLTATNAQGTTTFPLTLNLRTLDQVTAPPDPTPTPPAKAPRLALTSPNRVVTRKPNVTLRGKVLFAQKTTRLTVRVTGKKAQRVPLSANGRFAVRVGSLRPGTTLVEFRLTAPSVKPRTTRVKIQRRVAR